MKNLVLKYWWVIALTLVVGFFAGRCTDKSIVKVEYVKGETKTDTIYKERLVPYEVLIPANPVLPMKPDTIKLPGGIEYKYYKVDTAAIIADYIKLNKYSRTLFDDDKVGKLTVGAEVQYNKLNKLDYSFTPMEKQTTIIKQKVFTPFVSTSYNTFGYFGAGGGTYIKNIGVGAKYLTDFKDKGYEFELNYKF